MANEDLVKAAGELGISEAELGEIVQKYYLEDFDRFGHPNFQSISRLIGLTGIQPVYEETAVLEMHQSLLSGMDAADSDALTELTGIAPTEEMRKKGVRAAFSGGSTNLENMVQDETALLAPEDYRAAFGNALNRGRHEMASKFLNELVLRHGESEAAVLKGAIASKCEEYLSKCYAKDLAEMKQLFPDIFQVKAESVDAFYQRLISGEIELKSNYPDSDAHMRFNIATEIGGTTGRMLSNETVRSEIVNRLNRGQVEYAFEMEKLYREPINENTLQQAFTHLARGTGFGLLKLLETGRFTPRKEEVQQLYRTFEANFDFGCLQSLWEKTGVAIDVIEPEQWERIQEEIVKRSDYTEIFALAKLTGNTVGPTFYKGLVKRLKSGRLYN